MGKRYSAKLKFQVVREMLSGDKSAGQLGRLSGVHSNRARNWKETFLGRGLVLFAEGSVLAQCERRIAKLGQLVGRKAVEIAPLGGILGSGT